MPYRVPGHCRDCMTCKPHNRPTDEVLYLHLVEDGMETEKGKYLAKELINDRTEIRIQMINFQIYSLVLLPPHRLSERRNFQIAKTGESFKNFNLFYLKTFFIINLYLYSDFI